MKKALIVLGVFLIIAAVAALSCLSYLGLFSPVRITEKQMGPLTFVYVPHKGDYSKVGPVINDVCGRLSGEFGIKNARAMGIYYSDPRTTKKEDLKSDVGCLLDISDVLRVDAIMKKMKVRMMFTKKYCTAEFPRKNDISIIMGIIKVYPKMSKYMKAKGYKPTPAIEIYEKDRIIYAFEIKK
ncbi:MAG: GyrI-like domain-containing protein [bacterium]